MSNRPPLFIGETGTPGPGAYTNSGAGSVRFRPSTSTGMTKQQRKKFTTFGTSTRKQRQKIRAVKGSNHYESDSPGPGAYFTNQEVHDRVTVLLDTLAQIYCRVVLPLVVCLKKHRG